MTAFLWVAACWLTPGALIVAWCYADRWLDARHDADRTIPRPEVTPEWLAVLAATETTPVYDQLVCEEIERAEGWIA